MNPDEFYVFKTTLAQDKYPIIRRSIGSKLIKMEFTQPGEPGRVKTVDVPHEQRNRYSITDEDVIELANTRSSSRSTTSVRWTSSGARTAATARSSSCRHARKP